MTARRSTVRTVEEKVKRLLRLIRTHFVKMQTRRLQNRRPTGVALQVGEIAGLSRLELGGWRVLRAANVEEAQPLLEREEIPVVLCAHNTPGWGWRQAVSLLAAAPCRPSILLVGPAAGLPRWEEITAAGGYDVISEPLSADSLARAARGAYSHWRSRHALQPTKEVSAMK
jgi:DNA-binding NtrC family response regulator